MSELINNTSCKNLRDGLFATVSSIVLLAALGQGAQASEREERSTVWIELGGQLERIDGADGRFVAPFMLLSPTPAPYDPVSPVDAQHPPRYGVGAEGKLTFQPRSSDWILSAAIRYGRSSGNKVVKHQTDVPLSFCVTPNFCYPPTKSAAPFAKTFSKHRESHMVLDFSAGRDVGLGMFGQGYSILNAGLRIAQFHSRADTAIDARPVIERYNGFPFATSGGFPYIPGERFNQYALSGHSTRSFHGVGPSLSWEASAPLVGQADDAMFALDWGVNGAILFGRQRAEGAHQTTATHYHGAVPYIFPTQKPTYEQVYQTGKPFSRSRSIVVPNVGGFAAISLKFPSAKVSLGYRADFFIGAMDTGIDVRKKTDVSFHGPFATISIGLGG